MRKIIYLLVALSALLCNLSAQTPQSYTYYPNYTDNFDGDLSNWYNPTGEGSWVIDNNKLVGSYGIGCGSIYCPQADLILNDELQISDNWRATASFTKEISYTGYPNPTSVASSTSTMFSIWQDNNRKMAVNIGEGWDMFPGGMQDSLFLLIQLWDGAWSTYYLSPPGVSSTGRFKYPGGTWNADELNTASVQKNGKVYKFYFNDFFIGEITDEFITGTAKIGFHEYGSHRIESFQLDSCSQNSMPVPQEAADDFVLTNIMSGLKIVERLQPGNMTLSVDQSKMLTDNYNGCTKVGDYIVYTKSAQSLDPIPWSMEAGTAFTGDRLSENLQFKFAWKSDGMVYIGAIGNDDEVLASIADGNFWGAADYPKGERTFMECFALNSELKNLQSGGIITGIPHTDSLITLSFYSNLNVKIFNRFSKPIFKVYSQVALFASPNSEVYDVYKIWCPFSGLSTGTGIRSFNLSFSNPLNSYVLARSSNDNSNSSYVKLDGLTVTQKSKWSDDYYRRTGILPGSVEIGTTIAWSQGIPSFSMAVVCDEVTVSDFAQTPSGGFSNNHPPVIIEIPAYVPSKTLSFENQSILAGRNITIDIKAGNLSPEDNIISYQFDFNYNAALLEYLGYSLDETFGANGTLQVNESPGKLSCGWISSTKLESSGTILKLQFRSISEGSANPAITNAKFNEDIVTAVSNGIITSECLYGDVTANNEITAYDAALVLQYSIGLDPLTAVDPLPWETWRLGTANVDGLEGITANDAALILQKSVNIISEFPAETGKKRIRAAADDADVVINVEDGKLIFKSLGNLIGLNVFVNENKEYLGQPQFSDPNLLTAVNISESTYAIGVCTAVSLPEGASIMEIPYNTSSSRSIVFTMIINSISKQVTIDLITGMIQIEDQISVYPNPAGDFIKIKGIAVPSLAMIYDLNGKLLQTHSIRVENPVISLSGMPTSIYILKLQTEDGVIIKRFAIE